MSRSDPDKADLERLFASGAITAARSPVYLWLRRNHAGLAAQLTGARIRWASVAATLVELGVTDANGAPPQPATVRRTWWRVRRDVALAQARAEGTRQKPTVIDAVRPVAAVPAPIEPARPAPAFDPMEGVNDPPPLPRFRPAKLRD